MVTKNVMTVYEIQKEITITKDRLDLYYEKEKEILKGGVQAYGLGTRSVSRYNAALSEVRAAIKALKKELDELEAYLNGNKPRKAVGVIPRDW